MSVVGGGGDLGAEEGRSFVRHGLQENDMLSVETSQLQGADQVELIVNINRAARPSLPSTSTVLTRFLSRSLNMFRPDSRPNHRFGLELA